MAYSNSSKEKVIIRIADMLKADNIIDPENDTYEKAEDILTTILKEEVAPLSVKRYAQIHHIEGDTYLSIFEKGNNFYPDEIVEQIPLPKDLLH